ncbi:hypothetical protein A3731_22645 [Roseovarius sp. HI0049]|nr:hypothetical protein A3731_22645 [Roseovarius sp. HI0049]
MPVVVYDTEQFRHRPDFYLKQGKLGAGLEKPERAEVLLESMTGYGAKVVAPYRFDLTLVRTVHSSRYIDFLLKAQEHVNRSDVETPEIVPPMTRDDAATIYPISLFGRAAWHMYDFHSPIGRASVDAAIGAAQSALTAAQHLLDGETASYALCRPPGHHAHADFGGGYCYLNNAAIAARYLTRGGHRVAILDIDADHGNGTQSIFYEAADVFHASLHADPRVSYPYFSGHAEERGRGPGLDKTLNVPLQPGTADLDYLEELKRALDAIDRFDPAYCVVALGVDGHVDEPNHLLSLTTDGLHQIGATLASLGKPMLFTQEGGYNLATLGENVAAVIGPLMGFSSSFPSRATSKLMGTK